MSFWKNTQMVITTVLLLLAAACPLFEKDITVPYLFTLRLDPPGTAPHQLPEQRKLSTNSGEATDESEKKNAVDRDFLSLEMMATGNLPERILLDEIKIALSGTYPVDTAREFNRSKNRNRE